MGTWNWGTWQHWHSHDPAVVRVRQAHSAAPWSGRLTDGQEMGGVAGVAVVGR
jgi:hypothetical protein